MTLHEVAVCDLKWRFPPPATRRVVPKKGGRVFCSRQSLLLGHDVSAEASAPVVVVRAGPVERWAEEDSSSRPSGRDHEPGPLRKGQPRWRSAGAPFGDGVLEIDDFTR
jgi:hypothetical protein